MTEYLEITPALSISTGEIEFTYVRSSGPGGQNVNKVASKAVLRWNLGASPLPDEAKWRFRRLYPSYISEGGDVILTGQRFRDAPKNRTDCLEKLRQMILKSLEKPKKRIPTKPTRGSVRRRLAEKAKHSAKKELRRPPGADD
ncbi:MAG: aminoacyl-tRNA hydrolase [Thermoguttaceae bacterium]|nr:aminoacyl-tRNA hydrolase [Thermoguttaceae bacterium]